MMTQFRFLKTIITIRIVEAGAITCSLSPPNQRYTGAKDGNFQGDYHEEINAVELLDSRIANYDKNI
jgi:hypothetical protein